MVIILVVIAALGAGVFGIRATEPHAQQAAPLNIAEPAAPGRASVAVKPG